MTQISTTLRLVARIRSQSIRVMHHTLRVGILALKQVARVHSQSIRALRQVVLRKPVKVLRPTISVVSIIYQNKLS